MIPLVAPLFNSVCISSFYSAKNARAPQTTTDPSSFVAANAPYVPHTCETPQIGTTDTISQVKLLRRQICSDGLLKHGIVFPILVLVGGGCHNQPACRPYLCGPNLRQIHPLSPQAGCHCKPRKKTLING